MSTYQQQVNETNAAIRSLQEDDNLGKRILAIGVEINQKYVEYLDSLLDGDLSVHPGITINIDGEVIHFDLLSDYEEWLAERMSK